MNPVPVPPSFRFTVKSKIAYHLLGVVAGVIFIIVHLVKSQFENFFTCTLSVVFTILGVYVDVQFLRGHWRTWSYILLRFVWIGVFGIVLSVIAFFVCIAYHVLSDGIVYSPPLMWLILTIHWSALLCYSSKKFHYLCTDSYTLSKGSN
ncbi:solute carrier family 48 (heme transporter), member 1 [Paragonimus westermani]|uniref:Solute carrier family 48 (Heme transporter), member 1 n=1 Tax=Paragonimus westermani TaxID=34504 RepID=A0A5J4NF75_9TREM|nr:solute carrier family 48 (heme transporter), member 1 [Paragonimus westermani]